MEKHNIIENLKRVWDMYNMKADDDTEDLIIHNNGIFRVDYDAISSIVNKGNTVIIGCNWVTLQLRVDHVEIDCFVFDVRGD